MPSRARHTLFGFWILIFGFSFDERSNFIMQRSFSNKPRPDAHGARSHLKKGKDSIRKDDALITFLEKDNILAKYDIDKESLKSYIDKIKQNHLSISNMADILKEFNISKADEDILINHINRKFRKK
jgi:hypothetical protein